MGEFKKSLPPRAFFVVLVLGVGGIFYEIIKSNNLYDSAVLYLGLPLLLALGLSLTPKTKSALGATMKGITIALLLSAIVFQEGYICILFAAPIFYLVGILIAVPIDQARKKKEKPVKAAAVAILLAILSLEGTTDFTTVPRNNTVIASKIIAANIEDVRHQLAKTPQFKGKKPFLLKVFPYPVEITGKGLEVGDIRQAKFIAYKHIWWTRVEGELAFKVVDSSPERIKFAVTKDSSYVSHYLKWQSSEVVLDPIGSTHTKVTWIHEYTRLLDPAWYFGFLQYYAVKLTTEQLIDYVATPQPTEV